MRWRPRDTEDDRPVVVFSSLMLAVITAEVKVTDLGDDDSLLGAAGVESGAGSGDTSDGPTGARV